MRVLSWMFGLFLGATIGTTWLAAQTSQQPIPPILTKSLVGRDLFQTYCAGCHGRDGRGDGPVATVLKVPPANLTTLAQRHGGKYPASLVEARLNGTFDPNESAAHGTTDMPIWGSIFRQLDAKEITARVRVQNLVEYVKSIQVTSDPRRP